MICVVRELIDEQLESDRNCGFSYKYVKLSNRLIDKLFKHYYAEEVCEHFYDSDEPQRIRFCNWQEAYSKGNFGMSQTFVNSYARRILKKNIRNFPYSVKGRLFLAKKDNEVRIYFYGRDVIKVDYWVILKKRQRV